MPIILQYAEVIMGNMLFCCFLLVNMQTELVCTSCVSPLFAVQVGDMLFGRLLLANKHMEAELVCIDSVGRSSGYGVIRDGGYMFKCPLNIVRK